MASSHAYTFWKPDVWEERRARDRARFKSKYGMEAPDVPLMQNETVATNTQRFREISNRLSELRDKFAAPRRLSLSTIRRTFSRADPAVRDLHGRPHRWVDHDAGDTAPGPTYRNN